MSSNAAAHANAGCAHWHTEEITPDGVIIRTLHGCKLTHTTDQENTK